MIAEARILRLGPGPRRRRGRGSCRYGPGRAGGIGGDERGQLCQTKPISGFFRLKMRIGWKNKANLPGPDCLGRTRSGREQVWRVCRGHGKGSGEAVRTRRPGDWAPLRQTKPICRWRDAGQLLFRNRVMGKQADCGSWKTKPICGAGVVRRSGPGAQDRVAPNKPNFRPFWPGNEDWTEKQSQFPPGVPNER